MGKEIKLKISYEESNGIDESVLIVADEKGTTAINMFTGKFADEIYKSLVTVDERKF